MTYGYRNSVLTIGLAASFISIVGFVVSLGFLLSTVWADSGSITQAFPGLPVHSWWLLYTDTSLSELEYLWNLGGLFLFLLIVMASCVILKRIYQRTASSEIFFFMFFLFSLTIEGLRTLNALLILEGAPVFVGVMLSKVIHFARFFGLFSFLFASLYSIEVSNQKFRILIMTSFLISLALTYVMPIDSSILLSNFLYKLGDEKSTWFITLILEIAVLANFLVAAFRKERREFALLALAVLLILAGREFVFFMSVPVFIGAGLVLTIVGIWLFRNQVHTIYLWPQA